MFNEGNTTEQMIIHTLSKNGWEYIPPEELDREEGDVMVESMVRNALIRLNPEIAEDDSRADEILYKLRGLFISTNAYNLVTQNELFKQTVFEKNSYPFAEDGRQVTIDFFGTEVNGKLDQNQCVVTNQWVFPKKEGGKRLDIVLLVNGFPFVIGELKTPVRSAITWLDGAQDINEYEQSIPQMFVSNVFNFATEGKCYRYGSVCMPAAKWGPWHTTDDKSDGSLAAVQTSVKDMLTQYKVMDLFQFFTLFTTDSKYRKYKVISRYQQYEGANMIIDRVRAGYPKQSDLALTDMTKNCIAENARVSQDQTEYQKRYDGLVTRYDKTKEQYETVTAKIKGRRLRNEQLGVFIDNLKGQNLIGEFDERLWCSLVDSITVYGKEDIKVTFKDGTNICV